MFILLPVFARNRFSVAHAAYIVCGAVISLSNVTSTPLPYLYLHRFWNGSDGRILDVEWRRSLLRWFAADAGPATTTRRRIATSSEQRAQNSGGTHDDDDDDDDAQVSGAPSTAERRCRCRGWRRSSTSAAGEVDDADGAAQRLRQCRGRSFCRVWVSRWRATATARHA